MDDLFAPPAYRWKRLSPKYLTERRLLSVIGWAMFFSSPRCSSDLRPALVAVRCCCSWPGPASRVARYFFLERTWTSWGYVERDVDLYITHGVWFRSLTAVPYGRMQLVEVQSGPVDRSFGLASVTLKTASPNTDATIPGLEPEEASRLRDRLTQLGEAHASGL